MAETRIEQQHARFLRDVRSGAARATDLMDRYTPFVAPSVCERHPLQDHLTCPECAQQVRERAEAEQVRRFRDELWREQQRRDEDGARAARL